MKTNKLAEASARTLLFAVLAAGLVTALSCVTNKPSPASLRTQVQNRCVNGLREFGDTDMLDFLERATVALRQAARTDKLSPQEVDGKVLRTSIPGLRNAVEIQRLWRDVLAMYVAVYSQDLKRDRAMLTAMADGIQKARQFR